MDSEINIKIILKTLILFPLFMIFIMFPLCVFIVLTAFIPKGRVLATKLYEFFGWIGMGLGGFLGGYFFDIYGDYNWAFTFAGLSGIINLFILSLFFMNIRKRQKLLVSS